MYLINLGIKLGIFVIFTSLIFFTIQYLISLAAPLITSYSISNILSYFGFFTALNLYISILASGFGVKQVLAFIRN